MIQKLLFNTPAILFSAHKKAVRFGMSSEPTPGDQNPARELEAGDLFQKAVHEMQTIAEAPDTFTRTRREKVRTPKYKEVDVIGILPEVQAAHERAVEEVRQQNLSMRKKMLK